MFFPLFLALAAPAAEVVPEDRMRLEGRCTYNQEVLKHRDDTVLAQCDAVALDDRENDTASIAFDLRSWDVTMLRFQGKMTGPDTMTVRQLTLRNGTRDEATGSCRIFRVEGRVSVVSCLATIRGRAYAANIDVSHNQN
ncbi:MAG: hypothetical protein CMH85_07975 [Novosphingobium sp.]|nr:hypothetical protein [Novosphingobium sp.]|tara:strand:- start:1341 stop:1757 length:417 start_codon:yes stop_codon:yes gene_type:complete